MEHPNPDQIMLYAADQLESGERELVRAHLLGGCPICAGRFAEAEAMLALVLKATPRVALSPVVYTKISSKCASNVENAHKHSNSRSGIPWTPLVFTGLGSAAAAALVTFAWTWEASNASREIIQSSRLQLVALAGSDKQSIARGRVLWDHQHGRWQVSVFNLAPPPPGRTYELWFITADQIKVRATTFTTDVHGQASLLIDVPGNLNNIAVAAITDEPSGGSSQPTGSIELAGKVES